MSDAVSLSRPEVISELTFQHEDGRLYNRIEMEQQIRERLKPKFCWKLLGNQTPFELNSKLIMEMRYSTALHWVLDQMVQQKMIEGPVMGHKPTYPEDETYMADFRQRLVAFVQAGHALPPEEGEGVVMSDNRMAPPPPPPGANGVPQQMAAPPPPPPPMMGRPGGPPPPPPPHGGPQGYGPPAGPQFAQQPPPQGPPQGGYAQPPHQQPPQGYAPQGAPPPPPQQAYPPGPPQQQFGFQAPSPQGPPMGMAPPPPPAAAAPQPETGKKRGKKDQQAAPPPVAGQPFPPQAPPPPAQMAPPPPGAAPMAPPPPAGMPMFGMNAPTPQMGGGVPFPMQPQQGYAPPQGAPVPIPEPESEGEDPYEQFLTNIQSGVQDISGRVQAAQAETGETKQRVSDLQARLSSLEYQNKLLNTALSCILYAMYQKQGAPELSQALAAIGCPLPPQ